VARLTRVFGRMLTGIVGSMLLVACPEPRGAVAPQSANPEDALLAAHPRQALSMMGFDHGPDEALRAASEEIRVLFAIASLDLERWGDAEIIVPRVKDPVTRDLAHCYLAGKRTDIDGERRCRDALKAAEAAGRAADYLTDSAELGLAASVERNNRLETAAELLAALTKARPNIRNRKALHAFYDRVGWIKEDVVALEAWALEMPDDVSVKGQLIAALDRKVKGDILEARGQDAEAAARRLLVLDPDNGSWRFYLADALALLGKKDESAKERAAAVASGATPPKASNAVREMPDQPARGPQSP